MKPQISISLSEELLAKLDRYAESKRWSRSQAAALILEEALSREASRKAGKHG